MSQYKVLIVGQGLAGSILAIQLSRRKIPFLLLDKPGYTVSSGVAAGMMNPIVFRYLTLGWRSVNLFNQAIGFYRDFEAESTRNLLHQVDVARILGEGERIQWEKKSQLPGFGNWIDLNFSGKDLMPPVEAPHGFGLLRNLAWLDVEGFLHTVREKLYHDNSLIEGFFSHDKLRCTVSGFEYEQQQFDQLVFCEGHRAIDNPWFKELPFRPVKGELLRLFIPKLRTGFVLSKDVFLLPIGDGMFKLGATFDWNDLSNEPTMSGKRYLLDKLQTFYKGEVKVVDHQAGIRPAMADRRPVAGEHPVIKGMYIFNGLGAKGVMLAPAIGSFLADKLAGISTEDDEISPSRFDHDLRL